MARRPVLLPRVALPCVVALALVTRLWAASKGAATLDSDEAVFGLMARHVAQGDWSPYYWGQRYVGAIEPALMAPLAAVSGSVVALRLPSVGLFLAFLLVHARLVERWFGRGVAVLAVLAMALPSWLMFQLTYKPSTFSAMALLGTAGILAADRRPFLGAALLGSAVWAYPMGAVYLAAATVGAWLRAPPAFGRFGPLALAVAAALVTLAFFSGACLPPAPRAAASALLALAGVATVVHARRRLAVPALGFALGSAPTWLAWFAAGIAPSAATLPSCPDGLAARALLVLASLLPLSLGLPPLDAYGTLAPTAAAPWALATVVVAVSLAMAAWSWRGVLRRLVGLVSLPAADIPAATVVLLLLLPLALAALSANAVDFLTARYLMVAWQASSVVLALCFVRLWRRWRLLGALALGLWLWQVGIGNFLYLDERWRGADDAVASASVAALERHLASHDVDGGFADYWIAYRLDLLTGERLTFAPYNGVDRYPPYTLLASSLARQAYVLRPGLAPEGSTLAVLDAALSGPADPIEAASPEALERLRLARLVDRSRVADWDVWVVQS